MELVSKTSGNSECILKRTRARFHYLVCNLFVSLWVCVSIFIWRGAVQPPKWSPIPKWSPNWPWNDPQGFLSRTRNDPQVIFRTEWYHNGTKSVLAFLNQFRIYRLSTPIAFTFTEHNFKNRTNKDWKISPTLCVTQHVEKIKQAVSISKLFCFIQIRIIVKLSFS